MRLSAFLADADIGVGVGMVDPRTLHPDHVDDLMAGVDVAEVRRIIGHEISEAEDPAAMSRLFHAMLPPAADTRPHD